MFEFFDTIKYKNSENKFLYSLRFSVHDLVSIIVLNVQVKYQVHLVNKQVPTFAKLEMISLPSTLA